mgnify:CR=1 FL=1
MTSRADEIARKYFEPIIWGSKYIDDVIAALHEYGALVRARDMEMLNDPSFELLMELSGNPLILAASDEQAILDALGKIAAAISREPLP